MALRKIALHYYMLVAVGWGQGGGEVRACSMWKASATGKAHMKSNRKEDKEFRTKKKLKSKPQSHICVPIRLINSVHFHMAVDVNFAQGRRHSSLGSFHQIPFVNSSLEKQCHILTKIQY